MFWQTISCAVQALGSTKMAALLTSDERVPRGPGQREPRAVSLLQRGGP